MDIDQCKVNRQPWSLEIFSILMLVYRFKVQQKDSSNAKQTTNGRSRIACTSWHSFKCLFPPWLGYFRDSLYLCHLAKHGLLSNPNKYNHPYDSYHMAGHMILSVMQDCNLLWSFRFTTGSNHIGWTTCTTTYVRTAYVRTTYLYVELVSVVRPKIYPTLCPRVFDMSQVRTLL